MCRGKQLHRGSISLGCVFLPSYEPPLFSTKSRFLPVVVVCVLLRGDAEEAWTGTNILKKKNKKNLWETTALGLLPPSPFPPSLKARNEDSPGSVQVNGGEACLCSRGTNTWNTKSGHCNEVQRERIVAYFEKIGFFFKKKKRTWN